VNVVGRYYAYLERKCLESDKYSSLNEMRGQVLPWMGAALALMVVAMLAFPDGGTASKALWVFAFALWFIGIGFVGVAFTCAARKRRKFDAVAERSKQ
jgi:hypothetical protein